MAIDIFGNGTSSYTWVPNPTTRGSANILQSCIITIGLAVWTAVHLNIPEDGDPKFLLLAHQTWRKVGWVVVSLLAPEMLVYTAWFQLREANRFVNYYNGIYGLKSPLGYFSKGGTIHRMLLKIFKSPPSPSLPSEKPAPQLPVALADGIQVPESDTEGRRPWTRKHGFYAQMGGFVFETQAMDEYSLPRSRVRLNYSMLDKLLLFKYSTSRRSPVKPPAPEAGAGDLCDNLDIPKEELQDKSNASGLAKFLVCVQALWFCIQCLARILQHLPLSLLEVNTAVHALSALVIYILWWDKPLDIDQPTSLPVDDEEKIWWWAMQVATHHICFDCMDPPPASVWAPLTRILPSMHKTQGLGPAVEWVKLRDVNEAVPFLMCSIDGGREDKETLQGVFVLTAVNSGVWWPAEKPTDARYNRVHLAHKILVDAGTHTREWGVFLRHCPHDGGGRATNWPPFSVREPWVQPAFLLAAFLYGGLHCLAWNSGFPSPVQQLLWRISSVTIMAGGTLILACYNLLQSAEAYPPGPGERHRSTRLWQKCLYLVAVRIMDKSKRKRLRQLLVETEEDYEHRRIWVLINEFIRVLMLGFILAYFLARVYLIVECFIQLFHLPPGPIYHQPAWSVYFPHFG